MRDLLRILIQIGTALTDWLRLARSRRLCLLVLDGTRVVRFDAETGGFLGTFISKQGDLVARQNMRFGADGHLLMPGSGAHREPLGLLRFHGGTGSDLGLFAPWPHVRTGWENDHPASLALGPDGHLYAGSTGNSRGGSSSIYRFNATTGAFINVFVAGAPFALDVGTLAFGPDGHLYARQCLLGDASLGTRVFRYHGTTGALIDTFLDADVGQLQVFGGMAFGPDGHLYLSDYTYGSIVRYDLATRALIDTFVPQGALNRPRGLTFGPDGDLYVANIGGAAGQPTYGNVARIDGRTGTFVGAYTRLGTDHIFPTDVLVASMEVPPFPNLGGLVDGPRWPWILGAGLIGILVGRNLGGPTGRSRR